MLDNILKSKNKPHAILLIESKLSDVDSFIKQYMCSFNRIVNDKNAIQKIMNNQYFDLIKINGFEGNIKKEEVLNITKLFNMTAVENAGIKFYIIYGVENATSQAINSLLKFLEEPPQNTYAILTTRAVELVLPTIKSRCQTYIVKSDLNSFDAKLKDFNLTNNQKQLIKKCYFSYEEIINDLKNETFNNLYDLYVKLVKYTNQLDQVKYVQEKFTKLSSSEIKKLISFVSETFQNNEAIFDLLNNIKFNPVPILLFNQLWECIKKEIK